MHALTASLFALFLMAPLASGWLGVYLSQDSNEAVVSEVIPGTPAANAGLLSGDVLLGVGDTKTPTRDKFTAEIQKLKPGTRVKIKLRRNKREQVVVVRLGERPKASGAGAVADVVEHAQPRKPARNPKPARVAKPTNSAPIVEIAPRRQGSVASKEKGYLGISIREGDGGLVIDRILEGGPSAESGLMKGDVLQVIGDYRIRSLDDLDVALKKIRPGRKVTVGVARKDAQKSLMIKVGRRPGPGRIAIDKPVEIIEILEEPRRLVEVKPTRGHVIEVVPSESIEEVVIEVVPSEAKPGRRVTRPGRRAPVGTAGPTGPGRIARPAQPARPVASDKPPRPSNPSRGTGVRGGEYNLQRELKELRQELKALRRLLEQLRRDRR
jgi:membrane-associated protease RseP (regulator of RpoE activity)